MFEPLFSQKIPENESVSSERSRVSSAGKGRLAAAYVARVAVMSAMLTALKFALSFVPNVEVVTLLVMVYAAAFGAAYALPATVIFCAVETAIYGAGSWVVLYFVYWPLLALLSCLAFGKLRRLPLWLSPAAAAFAAVIERLHVLQRGGDVRVLRGALGLLRYAVRCRGVPGVGSCGVLDGVLSQRAGVRRGAHPLQRDSGRRALSPPAFGGQADKEGERARLRDASFFRLFPSISARLPEKCRQIATFGVFGPLLSFV